MPPDRPPTRPDDQDHQRHSLPSERPHSPRPLTTRHLERQRHDGHRSRTDRMTQEETIASLGTYGYGWSDSDAAGAAAQRELSDAIVADISGKKNEPAWMLEARLKALRIFDRKPMPHWGAGLDDIDFDNIKYFVRSTEAGHHLGRTARGHQEHLRQAGHPRGRSSVWSPVWPRSMSPRWSTTRSRDLEQQGVIFLDTDSGLREHPELFAVLRFGDPRPVTTSSPRSTPRCGRVVRSSTCRRACMSTSRCRPTSVSTPRTWASSSVR